MGPAEQDWESRQYRQGIMHHFGADGISLI